MTLIRLRATDWNNQKSKTHHPLLRSSAGYDAETQKRSTPKVNHRVHSVTEPQTKTLLPQRPQRNTKENKLTAEGRRGNAEEELIWANDEKHRLTPTVYKWR